MGASIGGGVVGGYPSLCPTLSGAVDPSRDFSGVHLGSLRGVAWIQVVLRIQESAASKLFNTIVTVIIMNALLSWF